MSQPWQEIAAVYDRNGQPSDARRIRITAARLTAEHSGPRTMQTIADVARDRGIRSWPTEAAFVADDPERRRSAHFIRGRLLDAPHDAGEWVLKHVVSTHEGVYVPHATCC